MLGINKEEKRSKVTGEGRRGTDRRREDKYKEVLEREMEVRT